MQRIPSIQALQCLEAAARCGSFTRAGDEMHLTQGGVSRQVLALEAWLGVALFERRREGLKLTPAGVAYLEEVQPALAKLESATAQLRALQGRGGQLTLSIPATWGNHWLMPRLPRFHRAHPDVSLNLLTHVGPADFANRRLDAAVEFLVEPRHDMPCEKIMGLSISPYASTATAANYKPKSAWPTAQMLQHTTLPDAWRGWQKLAYPGREPQRASGPRFDLMFMAMNAAISGMGVALLPEFLVEGAVLSGQLKPLHPVAWRANGDYCLTRSPLMKRESAFGAFSGWLRGEALV